MKGQKYSKKKNLNDDVLSVYHFPLVKEKQK